MHGPDITIQTYANRNANGRCDSKWEIQWLGGLGVLERVFFFGDAEGVIEVDHHGIRAHTYTIALVHVHFCHTYVAQRCSYVALRAIGYADITLGAIRDFVIWTR